MNNTESQIELQPSLLGNTIKLRPLEQGDFDALYTAASDPEIWAQHPDSQRYKRDIFQQRFFAGAIASGGALAIEEKATGRIIGSSRYYDWKEVSREIAIGFTFIERNHWSVGTNRELKDLMLNHIGQWVDVVWFHVGSLNFRSCRAVEKLGAILAHEEQRELDGTPFTQRYYKLDLLQFGGKKQ